MRSDFQSKLDLLEKTLKDSDNVIRNSLIDLGSNLELKMKSGDDDLNNLLNEAKSTLQWKIDSLAEVHSIDRKKQEERFVKLEDDQSNMQASQDKMKVKLDTLNYTEENFTQELKQKLLNVEEGATRSDNNFTDEAKAKLDGIEQNANNYQLPMATHNKLGGVQLSSEFLIHQGKIYTTLNPDNIDRQYAKDTISGNWSEKMQNDDIWTKVRYKKENGRVDASGNKLYDYGEWNQPYKFIYDDLETSFYEFNATDSANVILGIHEKNKKHLGKDNTLIGHKAGYTLYKGGERNVHLGKNAGALSQKTKDNVFVGNQAGESVGNSAAGNGEYGGERNVAVGNKAMQGRNANGKSVAIGYAAMEVGEQNASVILGYRSGANNSGSSNILIGTEAAASRPGSKNTNNIAIGYRTAFNSIYTRRNIFIGDSAALNNEAGYTNIFMGHAAGKNNKGNNNVIIGHGIDIHGSDNLLIGNKGQKLIEGNFVSGEVTISKLNTDVFAAKSLKSDGFSVGNKPVINNEASFVGAGGINTAGQISTTYANAKTGADKAISAPNGSISGKYVQASEAVLIGADEVIGRNQTFVGKGGVNTAGSVKTTANVEAKDLTVQSARITNGLSVAGFDILKISGGKVSERYAQSKHTHSLADMNSDANNRLVSDAEKSKWNNAANRINGANEFSTAEKEKLARLKEHPATHSADMITPTSNKQFVTQAEKDSWSSGQIPIGGIIMWNGTKIPDGWALCNGQTINGHVTPDLRGRFIVGAYPGKGNYDVGKSGGSIENSPGRLTSSRNGAHDHSGSTGKYKLMSSDIPVHSHEFKNYYCAARPDDDRREGSSYGHDRIEVGIGSGGADYNNDNAYYRMMDTNSSGKPDHSRNAHSHSISNDGVHSHNVSLPYYVLAFIMRVK